VVQIGSPGRASSVVGIVMEDAERRVLAQTQSLRKRAMRSAPRDHHETSGPIAHPRAMENTFNTAAGQAPRLKRKATDHHAPPVQSLMPRKVRGQMAGWEAVSKGGEQMRTLATPAKAYWMEKADTEIQALAQR